MGRNNIWHVSLIVSSLCVVSSASPHHDGYSFLRSAVETIPEHEPIATPIRASVESVPLGSLREEREGRLPLRDAVEKRLISVINPNNRLKFTQDVENIPTEPNLEGLNRFYGAASYLNNGTINDERLHHGNANLQEMQQTATGTDSRRLVVCYLESWAAYRAPPLAFTASLVPKSCTHLHYAFAVIHPHTYAIIPANEDYDIIKGGYRIATGLKQSLPGIRVIISVGGDGTDRLFSEMVQSPRSRSKFIDSALNFLQEHDFDGLDLHWVYPGEKDDKEKDLLTSLLYEMREKFSSYGFLLTTVLPPSRYQIEDGYDLSAVSGATDYAVLQAWDMIHGKKDEAPSRALQHSALHRDPGASSRDQRYDNIEFVVKYLIRHSMAAEKLVLGIPLFGRSYTLVGSTQPSPGAYVNGWGEEGQYTQIKGKLAYFEICMAEREGKGMTNIDEAGNAYAVFDNQWITYDTPNTILEKMRFVKTSSLAGAAAWALDMDDFRGLCGSAFPMLTAIATSLNGEAVSSDQSSLKIGSCDSDVPYLASDEDSCAHFHFCSGKINYRMVCEEDRLYDPSTGFCGHQDVRRCIPGQTLRINVNDAERFLSREYEIDFKWSNSHKKEPLKSPETYSSIWDIKKNKDNDKRVVCYMTSWAFYRRGDGKFVPEYIDNRLCTHVVYAYASLSPTDLVAKEFDPWADLTNNLYERVTSLKDVKVLLGLGGWTDSDGDKYSRLVSSASARAKFTEKLLSFLRMHNFNGLHLDWNYPVCWQSNCKKGAASDKRNFAKFVEELSTALHDAGMELGVAISGYKEVIDVAYDLPAISKAADFLSSMTYDYHGGWEQTTGHHTPLVPRANDPVSYYSIEYAIKAMISGGADPKKLLLGLSFYGQSFRLTDVESAKVPGAPAAGPGEPGEFTKQPGMLAYYEICYRVKSLRWKTGRQDNAGPYAYSDSQWVGYDDPKSITEKVEWAMRQGLGGVTAWAIDLDDFNNRCCSEPSPLLRAAGRALGRSVPAPPSAACERPPQPVTPAPPTTTTAEADGSLGGSGGGSHGNHDHHTSTTWPTWTQSTTTPSSTQTWWPVTSTTTTTTTRRTTTTTTSTTTTKRPVAITRPPAPDSGNTGEGDSCKAGEYSAAPNDCEGYLQCESGHWQKHRCAPGLHWASSVNRCDWPSFANCNEKPNNEASTATTTLAPVTARPPKPTTIRTTTTTSTTTTRRPTTTSSRPEADAEIEGGACNGHDYKPVAGDCNSYLQCDGSTWRPQHCAPGLHWSPTEKQCDWPKYAKCKGSTSKPATEKPKPSRPATRPPTVAPSGQPVEDAECGPGEHHAPASSCDSYLLCAGGRWRQQRCPSGLHWDKRTNRCDWAEFAMCEAKPISTKSTYRPTTYTTTTKRPTTTYRPAIAMDENYRPATGCTTGTYHSHPKCEKFYVCVNGVLVAQSCAPGLAWRPDRSQCDFPNAASCSDRRESIPPYTMATKKPATSQMIVEQPEFCTNGEYTGYPSDCTRYRHCLFGRFEEFSCNSGLHWNQERSICDWPVNAKCTHVMQTTSKPEPPPPLPEPDIEDIDVIPEHHMQQTPLQDTPTKPNLLNTRYKLVCYYTNWSWYRPGIGSYVPEDIDPTLCTHIVYGFAVLAPDFLMSAHDSWADYDNEFYKRVIAYKRYGIKVSLALGGWNDSAGEKYSILVNDRSARERFVNHAVQFLEEYGFDGLDLDWEYPKCWQVDCSKGPDTDKEAFADFVQELSAVLKPRGMLLSSAVSPNKIVIDAGYDVPVLARYLDWIAVMTYDYHGQWDKKTGHVAPLYYHPEDDTTYFNANYTMHYWIHKGAPPSKLVMGMPLYGQSFTLGSQWDTPPQLLEKKNATGLNIPAITGGEPGEYTQAKGFLAYYEICDRIRHSGWQLVKDPYQRMGPYAYKDDQWVSFDDIDIIKKKVNFIKSLNLAGGMVWALDLDDFRNRCGQGKHPLMNAIRNGLLDPNVEPETVPMEPLEEPSNSLEEDLEDIVVRPGYKPKPTTAPVKPTTQTYPVVHTTKKPTTVSTIVFPEERYKVVCYYTNWAWYRQGSGKYTPNDIDSTLCTHIVYAFAALDSAKLVIKPHDMWLDIENKFYEKVVALKKRGVKVLLGLGGWDDSAGNKYSRLVNSLSARRKFVVHTLDFLEQHEFDGLDLDWEYPKCWQAACEKGPHSDKDGFASLVKELRAAFTPRGLLLSAAVSASKRVIDVAYDVPTLSQNLDWISLMTYDYHGQWEKKTGHLAPMYLHEYDDDLTLNVNYTVHYWIEQGAVRNKLILGVPFYGQSFSLMENNVNGLGAFSDGGGEPGDETRARGFLSFYEICERIKVQGWQVYRDPGGRIGPYASYDDQWVSFDDEFMIRHKAEYVRAMDLGGAMAWSLDLDDFTGKHCGCGKSPLLSTINFVLRNYQMPPPCFLEEIQGPRPVVTNENALTPDVGNLPEIINQPETSPYDDNIGNSEVSILEGKSCSDTTFKADKIDCSKYYLCLNGHWMELACPAPLLWNQNHCDVPENTPCSTKTYLRLTEEKSTEKPILACYFTNWAYYRKGEGSFGPEEVDPSLCTHIIYAWAQVDGSTYQIVSGNPELDVQYDFYGKLTELRSKGLKVILGVGGLKDSEFEKWSRLVASPQNRKTFVKSVRKFLQKWNFDGLQIAWQYPICKQIPCIDFDITEKDNYNALLTELSKALRPHNLEISAMVSPSPELASLAYDPEVLGATLDWISIAANDYYASNTGRTAYLVSLETSDLTGISSFNYTLSYWSSVVPARLLVLGVPAYSRSYTLRGAERDVGAPSVGPGQPGDYTAISGFLAYYEVCEGVRYRNWHETRTENGTYASLGAQWASYLRAGEVHSAGAAAVGAGLRGAALWALDLDDWAARCGCGPQPLLHALRHGLYEPDMPYTGCL
ncbi:probable chitinase 10 [Achroia grisella]|uniref:probable chitinase 10 n=1 Tax=Achroia grisella TaxID=688607 RepID=UPI0027D26FF5|nr:probable chitinase 10 [Achroia grisella]